LYHLGSIEIVFCGCRINREEGKDLVLLRERGKKGSIKTCAYLAIFIVLVMNILRDKAKT